MNRKPLALTEEQIEGGNPGYAAWEVLLSHMEELEGDDRIYYVRSLPKHWRVVYTGFKLQN